jgi:hypothetical protein
MSSNTASLFQIMSGMLCSAAAFGVLLSMMFVRGTVQRAANSASGSNARSESDIALFDLLYTDKTYLLASIMASIGALCSFKLNIGVFAMFVIVAVSFQIAEHWLLPKMRLAAQQGQALPMVDTRRRFEFLQAMCLLLVFGNLAMPPLLILVRIHGL